MALEVSITNGFKSLITTEKISKGDTVLILGGKRSDTPDRLSVQIDKNLHAIDDETTQFQYLNHNCSPNTYFKGEELIALKDLEPGDHVVFDYNSTEYELSNPFTCICGASNCKGIIKGYKHLSPAEKEAIKDIVQPYLLG